MALPFKKLKNVLGLDDTVGFGKYQRDVIEDVAMTVEGAKFIKWAISQNNLMFVTDDVIALCDETLAYKHKVPFDMKQGYFTYDEFDDVPF